MRRSKLTSFNFWYFVLFTALLYLPILLLIIFSFNDAQALVFPLRGFTTRWYSEMMRNAELVGSVWHSVVLGVLSSLVATALGAMAAIGCGALPIPRPRAVRRGWPPCRW
jgi:ABC-type spermidine/putrescine transport system permease subunit II